MFNLSASKLKTFKACRRKYQLTYLELLEPVKKEQALEMGSNYHKNIEKILNNEEIEKEINSVDDAKIYAMSMAFKKYILPNIPKVAETELKFNFEIEEGKIINGIIDALTEDGVVIEHKSSGAAVDEKYIDRLNWDDQVPIYMLATKTNRCYYDVCMKPTIRQKKDESLEEYTQRCIEWFDEDTDTKVQVFNVVRTPEELQEKYNELIAMCDEIENAKNFYRNQSHCSIMSCPYSSICLNYDSNIEPIGFKKREVDL